MRPLNWLPRLWEGTYSCTFCTSAMPSRPPPSCVFAGKTPICVTPPGVSEPISSQPETTLQLTPKVRPAQLGVRMARILGATPGSARIPALPLPARFATTAARYCGVSTQESVCELLAVVKPAEEKKKKSLFPTTGPPSEAAQLR